MFNYPKWRAWLQTKAAEFEAEGIKTSFRSRPDDDIKPAMILEVVGRKAMGGFENWITGETDYTVMAPPSPKAQMVSHKWGLIVTDETFEATFDEFVVQFRQHDSGL